MTREQAINEMQLWGAELQDVADYLITGDYDKRVIDFLINCNAALGTILAYANDDFRK